MTERDLAGLNAAEAGMVRRGAPIPLVGLLTAVSGWIEQRHLELLAEAGFDDVRLAHNAVFTNMPEGGIRLTELAATAGVSKQAMAEMVNELVDKGYLHRVPDPTDGRAKLIRMAERGEASHLATLEIFAAIESELAAVVGKHSVEQIRSVLTEVVMEVILNGPGSPAP